MIERKEVDLLKKANNSEEELPYELVPLPSRGWVYPENHPLCNETHVEIKAMGTTQENILVSQALIKKGTVMTVLLKSCLTNASIDPSSLILGDKSAILLAIRRTGFGAEYRMPTTCPECGDHFVHDFDLSKCELKMLEEEPVEPNKNLFEMLLPVSKKTIHFSLMTDGDDLDIMRTQQNRKKVINSDIDTRITDELMKTIKSVDGKEDGETIAKFVRTMKVMDSRALRRQIKLISPDVEMKEEVSCGKCGAIETHRIPLGTEFFWPSLEP